MKKGFTSFLLLLAFTVAKAQFNGGIIIGPQAASVSPAFTYAPDTVTRSTSTKAGLRVGFITNIPLSKKLFVHTGIIYSAKGAKEQQLFDESSTDLQTAITDLSVAYIDAPLNLLLKLPLKGKTKFLLGAGPQLSLFYNGNLKHTLVDVDGKFRELKNEDLPVGKGNGQFRTLHFSANGMAGLEFGRVFITANYSSGITGFYQKEKDTFKHTTYGATLGIYLGKPQVTEPVVKDGDGDGVPDSKDACPELAGTALTNGCPDGDGDGISDNKDKCPTVAGLAKYGGCPVPDTDGDGVNDELDRCPTIAGLAKYNGCPVPDRDKDGIADEDDRCPDNAGTAESGGCPKVTEKEKETVKHAARRLQFQFQSARLDTASYRLLDEVVHILKAYPQLTITIEGHTAGTANEANLLLSQQRADNVKTYIYNKGIHPGRITAIGYGATRPLVKTTDAKAGAVNRRVEINLSE